jgi:hypothetical protein
MTLSEYEISEFDQIVSTSSRIIEPAFIDMIKVGISIGLLDYRSAFFLFEEASFKDDIETFINHKLEELKKIKPVVGFFQDWGDGKSALYLSSVDGQDSVDYRIESHYESGTFAEAYLFWNEDLAYEAYQSLK